MNNNGVENNTNQTIPTVTTPNVEQPITQPQTVTVTPNVVPATQPVLDQPTIISIESIVPNAKELQAATPQVVVPQQPEIVQTPIQTQNTQPVLNNEPVLIPMTNPPEQPVQRPVEIKKSKLTPILIIVVILLVAYIAYTTKTNQIQINNLIYNCSPINASKETKQLDINSSLVQRLYRIVQTNIREDVAQTDYDNTYKAYLVLRQMGKSSFYESNCNMFDPSAMEPFKCEGIQNFYPKAIREEDYILKWKEIYGENTEPYLGNIKLKNECIGGYQYIEGRHEFVEGYCDKQNATTYKVNKSIKSATSTRNIIIITEEVKYKDNEGKELPEQLKDGYYIYTFRLDINYNYVLVNKEYQSKY